MALQEVTNAFLRRMQTSKAPLNRVWALQCRRYATGEAAAAEASVEIEDLEQSSFQDDTTLAAERAAKFDPAARARQRGKELPPSRYQFRPPKYYRGPLHPHQPPPSSDPAARDFIPGPFSLPRLEQTFRSTIEPDLMTMSYMHFPPGFVAPERSERLRSWVGDNPYFKNRPRRGPRGGDVLRLIRKPITWQNVPRVTRITVHSMVKDAKDSSAYLHAAGMVLQSITNVRAEARALRKSVAGFGVRQGQHLSVVCDLRGEDCLHFLSKVVEVVMPKIKDFKGMKGSSGDSSGNLALGLTPEEVGLFPEVEVNYDMYPTKMIPGCDIIIHTNASTDRDARLLLSSIGIPFYGKLVD